jgi:hypothetical protein
VLPSKYRQRAAAVGALLDAASGISHESDWTRPWAGMMAPQSSNSAGFGPPFRWLPALLEAWLFAMLPEDLKHRLFQRFRNALVELIEQSAFVRPFSIERANSTHNGDHFLGLSILSFQVRARQRDGTQRAMTEEECQRLFVYLNNDMSGAIPSLRPGQEGLARLQVHVGQPVTIPMAAGPVCVLRLVLGARFFNFVGHADGAAMEAALQSEIGDARRAIQKIELLASEWGNINGPTPSKPPAEHDDSP